MIKLPIDVVHKIKVSSICLFTVLSGTVLYSDDINKPEEQWTKAPQGSTFNFNGELFVKAIEDSTIDYIDIDGAQSLTSTPTEDIIDINKCNKNISIDIHTGKLYVNLGKYGYRDVGYDEVFVNIPDANSKKQYFLTDISNDVQNSNSFSFIPPVEVPYQNDNGAEFQGEDKNGDDSFELPAFYVGDNIIGSDLSDARSLISSCLDIDSNFTLSLQFSYTGTKELELILQGYNSDCSNDLSGLGLVCHMGNGVVDIKTKNNIYIVNNYVIKESRRYALCITGDSNEIKVYLNGNTIGKANTMLDFGNTGKKAKVFIGINGEGKIGIAGLCIGDNKVSFQDILDNASEL